MIWRFVSSNGCPFKRLQPGEGRRVSIARLAALLHYLLVMFEDFEPAIQFGKPLPHFLLQHVPVRDVLHQHHLVVRGAAGVADHRHRELGHHAFTRRPERQVPKLGDGLVDSILSFVLFQPRVGVGIMARYVYGKADLTSVPDMTLGGFQIGGGVRLRF